MRSRDEVRWSAGFNYGNDEIAQGRIEKAKADVECSRDTGRYDAFDKGVEAAISKHEKQCYYALDGTLMNAEGNRSIFDDVDK